MRIEFRIPPDIDPHYLERRLQEMVNGQEVRFSGHQSAFNADNNTTVARAMLRSVRARGGRPRFVQKTGTSDMNIVGAVWNCPIVAYGPGDSHLDHAPDEHIDLNEFGQSVEVLRLTIAELLSG